MDDVYIYVCQIGQDYAREGEGGGNEGGEMIIPMDMSLRVVFILGGLFFILIGFVLGMQGVLGY